MVKDPALRQLGEQIATARDAGHSMQIRGGGTRMFYGEPVTGDAPLSVLDMSGWRGIVDYEPSELVLTARAGTPLDEIENLLACHGQMLAFEPPRFGAADTLGGCVATGLSGPRRMAVGGVADFVLGTRLLNAAGEVLRFGGTVMKNVAGYDVSRLLVGSLGVLGVLTEVSLKVMPVPRCEATRMFPLDEAAALQQCLAWRSLPLPISATAWMPEAQGTRGCLWVRLSGSESAVRQGLDRIGGESAAEHDAVAFWSSLRDQTHVFFRQRPLWRIVLPPRAPTLDLGSSLHEWGGSLRWLAGPQDAATLRTDVRAIGGSACLYRRDETMTRVATFHPMPPALLRIQQRLKQQFDPTGVFNPHRLTQAF